MLSAVAKRTGKLFGRADSLRLLTTSRDELVLTSINEETKIATLTMNRQPVNSLSLELCEAISKSIKDIEASKAKAMVLTSSSSVFSAGLDMLELHQPQEDRLREFWSALQQVYIDLYGSKLATLASITGPAPAAGCMLAMACDYRVISKKGIIGLNEAQFGLVAPPWMADLMLKTVGRREAEKALMLGTLYSAKDALAVGLVDEVVEGSALEETCNSKAQSWSEIPLHSRVATKLLLRKDQLDHLIKTRSKDVDDFVDLCLSDPIQKGLGLYLASLKNKSGK